MTNRRRATCHMHMLSYVLVRTTATVCVCSQNSCDDSHPVKMWWLVIRTICVIIKCLAHACHAAASMQMHCENVKKGELWKLFVCSQWNHGNKVIMRKLTSWMHRSVGFSSLHFALWIAYVTDTYSWVESWQCQLQLRKHSVTIMLCIRVLSHGFVTFRYSFSLSLSCPLQTTVSTISFFVEWKLLQYDTSHERSDELVGVTRRDLNAPEKRRRQANIRFNSTFWATNWVRRTVLRIWRRTHVFFVFLFEFLCAKIDFETKFIIMDCRLTAAPENTWRWPEEWTDGKTRAFRFALWLHFTRRQNDKIL